MRRYSLRDDQWERIKNILPGRKGYVGVTANDNRLFVEAVLYRYRSGTPWRDFPKRFGDFRVIYLRQTRWSKTVLFRSSFERTQTRKCQTTQRFRRKQCPRNRRKPQKWYLSGSLYHTF